MERPLLVWNALTRNQPGRFPMSIPQPPRGIRLNNPGNIRRADTEWRGMVHDGEVGSVGDPDFVQFEAPQWGIRALARLLRTYQRHHDCHTVRAIIGRYAPPQDGNPTSAYVDHVAERLGVGRDDPLILSDADTLIGLVKAIIRHENGQQPYSDAVITRGVSMALEG